MHYETVAALQGAAAAGAARAEEVEGQPGRVVGEGEGAEAAVVLVAAGAKICRGTRGSACCDSDTTQSQ